MYLADVIARIPRMVWSKDKNESLHEVLVALIFLSKLKVAIEAISGRILDK